MKKEESFLGKLGGTLARKKKAREGECARRGPPAAPAPGQDHASPARQPVPLGLGVPARAPIPAGTSRPRARLRDPRRDQMSRRTRPRVPSSVARSRDLWDRL